MECLICNQKVKNLLALSTHIQFKHGNEKKEYYDLYMKKEGEGFCKICGNTTNFRIFSTGYAVYCSKECETADYSDRMKNENPMKNQVSKDNQRNTNQKRYGVNSTMQLKSVMDKRSMQNMERHGVKNVSQLKEVMEKSNRSRSETCMKEHGLPHYFMVYDVKQKIIETCLKRYGVRHPLQNEKVFNKNQKSGCQAKPYEGLYYRGSFELDFLEKYYSKLWIRQGLSFEYEFAGSKRKYFSDFYLPDYNMIVEIKNSYSANKFREKIDAKKAAVLAAGYDFVMVIDKDYSILNPLLEW